MICIRIIKSVLLFTILTFTHFSLYAQSQEKLRFTFPIAEVISTDGQVTQILLNFGSSDGIQEGAAGQLLGLFDKDKPARNSVLGTAKVTKLSENNTTLIIELKQGAELFKGDLLRTEIFFPKKANRTDVFNLVKHNIFFTDAKNQLLYERQDILTADNPEKQANVIRVAQREAQEMGKFNKGKFDSLMVNYGKFKGRSLYQAIVNLRPNDIRSFFRYLDAAPNEYMGRQLDMGVEIANWIYRGATMSYLDLAELFLEANTSEDLERLQKNYSSYITPEVLKYWYQLCNYYYQHKELAKAVKLNEVAIRFYKITATADEVGLAYYYQAELYRAQMKTDQALKNNESATAWFTKAKHPLHIFQSLQQKGTIYEGAGEVEQAVAAYTACADYGVANTTGTRTFNQELVAVLQKLAIAAEQTNDYTRYLNYQKQKLQFQSPSDKKEYGLTLAYIGFAENVEGHTNEAIRYYHQALATYDQTKLQQKGSASIVHKNLGSIYHNLKTYDSALYHYQAALEISESLVKELSNEATQVNLADLIEVMANSFLEKGETQEALALYQKLYGLRKKIAQSYPSDQRDGQVSTALTKIGQINTILGQGDKALKFFEEQIAQSKASGDQEALADAYWDMAKSYSDNFKNHDKAIENYQKALNIYESLENEPQQGRLWRNIGLNYYEKTAFDQALTAFERALTINQKVVAANPSDESQNEMAWTYDKLADTYRALQQPDQAIAYYKKRIELHEKHGKATDKGDAYWDIAIAFSDDKKQYQEAINYYEKALIIYKNLDLDVSVGSLYRNLALNYSRLKDEQHALANYQASYKIRKKVANADPDSTSQCRLAQSLDGLADVHRSLGDYEAAIQWQQERVPIYQHYNNPEKEADSYWDLATIYGDNIKDYQKAIDFYEKAISVYEELKDKKNLATLYNNIAIYYSLLNKFDESLIYNNQALALHQELHQGDSSTEYQEEIADDLEDIGYRYYQQDQYELAEQKFAESIKIRQNIATTSQANEAWKNLAGVYNKLADNYLGKGQNEKALQIEQKRLDICLQIEDHKNIADANFNMAYIKNKDAKYEEAIDLYEKALKGYLVDGDTSNAAITYSNIGMNYWRLLDYDKAIDAHLKSIDLAEKIDDHERIGSSYSYLADLYKQTGDPNKSLEAYNKSIEALNQVNDKAELMTAYADLGGLYLGNKDYQKALAYYEQSLELARLANNQKKQGKMMFHIANVYFAKNDYKNSGIFYEKSLDIRKAINDRSGQSYCLANLGLIEVINTNFDAAKQLYEEAISIAKSLNDKDIESYCRNGLANLLLHQGKYNEAEQVYLSILEYYTETKDYPGQVNTAINIANLYANKGDFDKALEMYEEAQLIAKKAAYKKGIANSNTEKANIYRILGDFDQAWEIQQQSLTLFEEDDNPWGVANAYLNLGNIKNAQGKYKSAIQYYLKSDSLYQNLGNQYSRAVPMNNIGNVYYWQGDYEQALTYFKKSVAILDKLEIKDAFRATVDGNIAEIYYKQGKYDEAEKLLLNSLAEGRKFEDKGLISMDLEIIGRAKIAQQEYEEAEQYLDEAYKLSKTMKAKSNTAWISSTMGRLYYEMQDFEEAERYLSESLKLSDEIGSNKYKWEVLYHKGLIAKQQNQLEESKKHLVEAVKVLEDLQSKLTGGDEAKQKFSAGDEKVKLYDALIAVLIEKGEIELAQDFLDRSNNEDLRNQFKQLNIKFGDENKNRVLQKEKELKAKLDNLSNELEKEKAKGEMTLSEEKIKRLEATKSIAEEKYIKFVNETFRSNPSLSQHFSKSINPIELKTDKNKRLIPKDIAMISYLPGNEQLYIFAATSDTVIARIVKVNREDLMKKVTFMHSFGSHQISGGNTDKLSTAEAKATTDFDGSTSQFKEVSEDLYRILIEPVEKDLLTRTKVGIVPSGMLHFLPFQMLGKKEASGKFNFLVQKHTIFYANSLKMLERFVGKKEELKVLAFGNADNSLPATEKEVNAILDLYPNSKVFVREKATEDLVKQASDEYNVLHFATHGNLDFYNFDQSYLTLAKNTANGEDGRLTIEEVWEIESLYNYKLVTLSACETAVSDKAGSWPVSPATSFIDAGANTVVASLWSVDDKATSLLMKYFYQNLATMEKVEALRMAQLQLGAQEDYKHPYYWAPFVLIGDWR